MSGVNFPHIVAWEVHATSGSLNFSRSNLSLGWFGFLTFFRWTRKVIITRSWSLPMSAPEKLLVLWMLTPGLKCFLTKMLSIWLWCFWSGLCKVLSLDGLWGQRVFLSTRLLKVANSRSLRPLSFVSILQDAWLLSLVTWYFWMSVHLSAKTSLTNHNVW